MDITPLLDAKSQVIRSYAPGQFTVSGVVHQGAIIVFPDRVTAWSFAGQARDLTIADFRFLLEENSLPPIYGRESKRGRAGTDENPATALPPLSPLPQSRRGEVPHGIDILLVGCGAEGIFLPELRRALKDEAGMTAEFMDTGAACRTYNVLMAEGRRVAAALIPLKA